MPEALSETPIGPNRCHTCGGEYGQHLPGCKVGRVEPQEVSMLEVLLENRKLKGQVASLRAQATLDSQALTDLREKLERAQKDAERLHSLQELLRACRNAVVAFNDDPDVECDDTENGFCPIGFRIVTSGCIGIRCDVAPTLGEAIDASLLEEPHDD